MSWLLIKNVSDEEWAYPIEERRKVVGRSRDAEIPIPPRFVRVSRRHAEVWVDRYGTWIHDLGSQAGTSVNGLSIRHLQQASIAIGDTIGLGGVELEVSNQVSTTARHEASLKDADETPVPPVKTALVTQWAEQLKSAEVEVVLCLTRGHTSDQALAKLLHRSPATVQTELRNVFLKLGVHSRAELLSFFKTGGG
jgi:pSer/pThr/pTyr-binding forkhead associated (FHA) protein